MATKLIQDQSICDDGGCKHFKVHSSGGFPLKREQTHFILESTSPFSSTFFSCFYHNIFKTTNNQNKKYRAATVLLIKQDKIKSKDVIALKIVFDSLHED